jgi:hypothetical protein
MLRGFRAALTALGLAALLLLGGCAPSGEDVSSALDAAVSATTTAGIALQELDDGAALPPFADTALADALTELDGAATDLTETGAITDPSLSADRQVALDAVREAADAVAAARDAVASRGPLDPIIDRVEAARDRLAALRGGSS